MAGTNPLSDDTDGDGELDSEELFPADSGIQWPQSAVGYVVLPIPGWTSAKGYPVAISNDLNVVFSTGNNGSFWDPSMSTVDDLTPPKGQVRRVWTNAAGNQQTASDGLVSWRVTDVAEGGEIIGTAIYGGTNEFTLGLAADASDWRSGPPPAFTHQGYDLNDSNPDRYSVNLTLADLAAGFHWDTRTEFHKTSGLWVYGRKEDTFFRWSASLLSLTTPISLPNGGGLEGTSNGKVTGIDRYGFNAVANGVDDKGKVWIAFQPSYITGWGVKGLRDIGDLDFYPWTDIVVKRKTVSVFGWFSLVSRRLWYRELSPGRPWVGSQRSTGGDFISSYGVMMDDGDLWHGGAYRELKDLVTGSWTQLRGYTMSTEGAIAAVGTKTGQSTEEAVVIIPLHLSRDRNGAGKRELLNDWPATLTLPRSPKHILGETDNIYIELPVTGLGSSFEAQVSSASDSTGIAVALNDDLSKYTNRSSNRGLRLSTASSGPSRELQVIDEELVTFTIKHNGSAIGDVDVMLDRAEFASGGIEAFYQNASGDKSVVTAAAGARGFFEAGVLDGANTGAPGAIRTFVRNAGEDAIEHREADLFHISCHGSDDGIFWDDGGGVIINPTTHFTPSDWNDDVEWIVAATCSQLNPAGGGRAAWQSVISSRGMHGILGAYDPLPADLRGRFTTFWNNINDEPGGRNMSYLEAYRDAMEDAPACPWAVLYRDANEEDRLKKVRRDTPGGVILYDAENEPIIVNCGRGAEKEKNEEKAAAKLVDGGKGRIVANWEKRESGIAARRLNEFELSPERIARLKKRLPGKGNHRRRDGGYSFWKRTATTETDLTKEQALELAVELVNRELPELVGNIKFRGVSTRSREAFSGTTGESLGKMTTGYTVSFEVIHDGVPVWRDGMSIGISGNVIDKLMFRYHAISDAENQADEPKAEPQGEPRERKLLDFPEVLAKSINEVKRQHNFDADYEVLSPRLYYVAPENARGEIFKEVSDFRLAWYAQFRHPERRSLVTAWFDAATGEIIGMGRGR